MPTYQNGLRAAAEVEYRKAVKKLIPDINDPPDQARVAAVLYRLTGLQPSEFKKLSTTERRRCVEDALKRQVEVSDFEGLNDTQRRSSRVSSVTIFAGEDSFIARADDERRITIPKEGSELFRLFATKIALNAASEWIELRVLNALVTSSPDVLPEYHKKASSNLRKAIFGLNETLGRLGEAPNKENFIPCRKSKGYYLNESITWNIGEERLMAELSRYSQSVFAVTTSNSRAIEDNTPSKGQRLPSLPIRSRSVEDKDSLE